ncbi:MAG: hypothetical protein Q4A98_08385 [Comamonadaceae bacterium]|nr:hypothetical protein [Comamonadaceae bacterium]
MTRINLIPPAELCDQHLLAERRELTRSNRARIAERMPAKARFTPHKAADADI